MNALPEHRRIVAGRTHGRAWRPEDADPMQFYPAATKAERIAGVVLAVVLGIVGAALLAHWWAA
jgi:hypothetical protein